MILLWKRANAVGKNYCVNPPQAVDYRDTAAGATINFYVKPGNWPPHLA